LWPRVHRSVWLVAQYDVYPRISQRRRLTDLSPPCCALLTPPPPRWFRLRLSLYYLTASSTRMSESALRRELAEVETRLAAVNQHIARRALRERLSPRLFRDLVTEPIDVLDRGALTAVDVDDAVTHMTVLFETGADATLTRADLVCLPSHPLNRDGAWARLRALNKNDAARCLMAYWVLYGAPPALSHD